MAAKSVGGSLQDKGYSKQSNKELNLQAVTFRTYESSLFNILQESCHARFMALIGLTEFLKLSWTDLHQELALEFLKNYRKKRSRRTSVTSSVRDKKITLNKKLIASTFKISSAGYRHKEMLHNKGVISSLFDPVSAKRKGYYIRDCKDPAYFERLEALNRLICFKPPGHLVSAVLVDMLIHANIQPVDWASLLLGFLIKELDRVTCSLRETPSTLVGVHILLILSNQTLVTPEDRLAIVHLPFILLDGYSTSTSIASDSFRSSPSPPLPGSPQPGLRSEGWWQLSSKTPLHSVQGVGRGQLSLAARILKHLKRVRQYVQCASF